ncbi:MAG: oligosaccharide flippase family protein [Elainella sp. Prado103]|nr:oligosaccharide flippase family protein [Elainella sp. Prado103]
MLSERRQLILNSMAVMSNRLTQSIASFVLTAAIARLLGAQALGQYLIGFTYYFMFMNVVAQGFKNLFIRELARDPSVTPLYLISGSLLQFVFSLLGYGLLVFVVTLLPYSPETIQLCYLIGLALIPFSLSNVTEAIFQAQERMHLIAMSTVPVYLVRVGAMIAVMLHGYGIQTVALLFVLSELLILLLQWGLMLRSIRPSWRVDWNFIGQVAKAARTFLAIEAIAVLNSRRQLILLSLFGGEVAVGLFGAIAQFLMPFDIVIQSFILALFPKLSQALGTNRDRLRHLTEHLLDASLCIAVPYAVGLWFIGQSLLIGVYQDSSFSAAGSALGWLALSLIVIAVNKPLSQALIASNLERINLREVVVDTIVGGIITGFLIWQFQLMGAVMAPIVTNLIALSQFNWAVRKQLFRLHWWRIFRRSIGLAIIMIAVFWLAQYFSWSLIMTILLAMTVYGMAVILYGIQMLGGYTVTRNKLKSKLFRNLAKRGDV